MESLPSIYKFHDYRAYLKACFGELEKAQGFSLRKLANTVGVSHGYFSLVLSGQRNFGLKHAPKLAKELKLNNDEIYFFKNLVEMSDNRNGDNRKKALKNLLQNKKFLKVRPKEFESYQYLESWHTLAIREMSLLPNFKYDPQWIRSQLLYPVPLSEIKKSFEFLLKQGFIEKTKGDCYKPTQKNIECIGGVFQVLLRSMHHQMIELSARSLDKTKKSKRKQVGYMMPISAEGLEKAKVIIEKAKQELKKIENDDKKADQIYYINMSAFPLTKESK